MKNRMKKEFLGFEGGLFSEVEKADVGDSFAKLAENGVALMGWADPFMPDFSIPEHIMEKTLEAIKSPVAAHYTAPTGNMELRAMICQKAKKMYGVDLTLNAEGTDAFAAATTEAYNDGNDTIAIYYDGELISVPSVNAIIENGQAQITGSASYEEADNIASTIRIGGLNLELEEISSKVVGAQLGEEAISTSLKAGAIGLAAVCLFMIFVYLLPGFASSIALVIYVGLILLLLNAFDITLTLPGIAGIILGIGMAVDANVIIYTRIREEIAAGRAVESAITTGYSKALSAIVDG